jgi:hypothetical protein
MQIWGRGYFQTDNLEYWDISDNNVKKSKICNIKYLVVEITMFRHRNICKYTWTPPDGKTDNQFDHIVIDRRWPSSILCVRSFR